MNIGLNASSAAVCDTIVNGVLSTFCFKFFMYVLGHVVKGTDVYESPRWGVLGVGVQ